MRSLGFLFVSALAALSFFAASRGAAQDSPSAASLGSKDAPAMASLNVCLRLEDEAPFLGTATVRVMPEQGNELLGMPADAPGEFLFSGVTSGKYTVQVSAPGFQTFSFTTQIDAGPRQKMLFVPMKQGIAARENTKTERPRLAPDALPEEVFAANEALLATMEAAAAKPSGEPNYWRPHELEDVVPPVDENVACPCEDVLRGAGEGMSEFVQTLERFTATEKLEHFTVDRAGARKGPETRSFAYVVSVKQNAMGTFLLEEFRNGTTDSELFPAHTATRGSPAMALIFHPLLAGGFDFRCEGLGQWDGRQAWQVHFVQRADRPVQIRSYTVDGKSFAVALEGRAWIDPGYNQVLRLESELAKPIPEIGLTHEHFAIDYRPVQFHSTGQQLWLPQLAEIYVERRGKRFYRRHSFTDFKLFTVDAAQNIGTPGESFSFINTSERDVTGELTVALRDGMRGDPVMLRFVVPAHGRVLKLVGPGKDVNLPVLAVGTATFVHDGAANSVKVDTHLVKETSLDVIPQTPLSRQP